MVLFVIFVLQLVPSTLKMKTSKKGSANFGIFSAWGKRYLYFHGT